MEWIYGEVLKEFCQKRPSIKYRYVVGKFWQQFFDMKWSPLTFWASQSLF